MAFELGSVASAGGAPPPKMGKWLSLSVTQGNYFLTIRTFCLIFLPERRGMLRRNNLLRDRLINKMKKKMEFPDGESFVIIEK